MINVNLQSNIWKFYLFNFFRDFMFIIPVLVPFWQENGLNLTQIMLLQSIFAIAIILLEVPTGVVADKLGRRTSLIFGALSLVLGAVVYSLGHNFTQFAIAEIIWAFGNAFISGADSALIYDTLKQTKKEKDFRKIWGNARSFSYLATAIAAISGGIIAKYSLRLDWYLVVISMVFLFFVTLSFTEPRHYRRVEKKSYWKHTKECFGETVTNKNLLFLLLFTAILTSIQSISLWYYQPYMKESGIDIAFFGFVWASFSIFSILGSKYAHKIEDYLKESLSLWMIILLMTLSTLFMSFWFFYFGVIFIFMQQFVRGFREPIINDYTNKHLSTEKRATLLSIQSLAGKLLFAILGPIFGFLADIYSLRVSMLIASIFFFVAFAVLMIWNKNRK